MKKFIYLMIAAPILLLLAGCQDAADGFYSGKLVKAPEIKTLPAEYEEGYITLSAKFQTNSDSYSRFGNFQQFQFSENASFETLLNIANGNSDHDWTDWDSNWSLDDEEGNTLSLRMRVQEFPYPGKYYYRMMCSKEDDIVVSENYESLFIPVMTLPATDIIDLSATMNANIAELPSTAKVWFEINNQKYPVDLSKAIKDELGHLKVSCNTGEKLEKSHTYKYRVCYQDGDMQWNGEYVSFTTVAGIPLKIGKIDNLGDIKTLCVRDGINLLGYITYNGNSGKYVIEKNGTAVCIDRDKDYELFIYNLKGLYDTNTSTKYLHIRNDAISDGSVRWGYANVNMNNPEINVNLERIHFPSVKFIFPIGFSGMSGTEVSITGTKKIFFEIYPGTVHTCTYNFISRTWALSNLIENWILTDNYINSYRVIYATAVKALDGDFVFKYPTKKYGSEYNTYEMPAFELDGEHDYTVDFRETPAKVTIGIE